jgi:hypothetical protein
VERPMPEEEPVIRMVLLERLVERDEGMVIGVCG